jgi:hypothetical protein
MLKVIFLPFFNVHRLEVTNILLNFAPDKYNEV